MQVAGDADQRLQHRHELRRAGHRVVAGRARARIAAGVGHVAERRVRHARRRSRCRRRTSGCPSSAASVTAVTAPAESSAAVSLPPGAQFGRPSVASRMKRRVLIGQPAHVRRRRRSRRAGRRAAAVGDAAVGGRASRDRGLDRAGGVGADRDRDVVADAAGAVRVREELEAPVHRRVGRRDDLVDRGRQQRPLRGRAAAVGALACCSMSSFIEPEASNTMRMSGGSLFSGCGPRAQFMPVTAPWPFWAAPPPTRPVPEAFPVPSGPPDDAPAPPLPAGAKPQPRSRSQRLRTKRF